MSEKKSMTIENVEFQWNMEKGQFLFEQGEAVLFWISTAMKSFFDTIEEISGEESSDLVFETTGFRQGLDVGKYFEKMKEVSVEEAAELITNTYASAGWGHTTIENLNFDTKTLTAKLHDSWEHKINLAQGKKAGTNFIPAHYAGVFTKLFGTNMWYEVKQYQLEGADSTIVEYFPSDITVSKNIHHLSRKKEAEQIRQLERVVENKTRELMELVKELSSPIIPVLDGIVVVPLLGTYTEDRSEALLNRTLMNLPSHKAQYLVLDLSGLDADISEYTGNLIEKIGSAASLIGTEVILVGITPQMSMAISSTGLTFSKFNCFQSLKYGIHYALAQLGRSIV